MFIHPRMIRRLAEVDARWNNDKGMQLRVATGPYRYVSMEMLIKSLAARAGSRQHQERLALRERKARG